MSPHQRTLQNVLPFHLLSVEEFMKMKDIFSWLLFVREQVVVEVLRANYGEALQP
jgi:hypothetical protein